MKIEPWWGLHEQKVYTLLHMFLCNVSSVNPCVRQSFLPCAVSLKWRGDSVNSPDCRFLVIAIPTLNQCHHPAEIEREFDRVNSVTIFILVDSRLADDSSHGPERRLSISHRIFPTETNAIRHSEFITNRFGSTSQQSMLIPQTRSTD